jgi:hypothetical protein
MEMEKRMSMYDTAFDPPTDAEDDDLPAPAAYLEDNRYDPAQQVETEQWETRHYTALQSAFAQLDDRSKDIVCTVAGWPKTKPLYTIWRQNITCLLNVFDKSKRRQWAN